MLKLAALLLLAPLAAPQSIEEELWQAAKEGDLDWVQMLIDDGVDVNARTEFDATAMYFAASNDHAEVCALLADTGAELDVADNFYQNTPIGMAGWLGHGDCVRVLIEKGSAQGTGALFAGAGNGHAGVVAAVLETSKLPQGVLDSACATAVGAGFDEVAEVLVTAGAKRPEAEADATKAGATDASASRLRGVEDPYVPVTEPRPWPAFRGVGSLGVADGQHPPLTWDLDSSEHVRWRAPVAGLGHSSPIVWGNRVFITTAVGEQEHTGISEGDRGWIGAAKEDFLHAYQVLCYGLRDGELLWTTTCHEGVPRAERHWKASHANSTVAVNDERVVALFAEGLFCLDHDGKLLWELDMGGLDAGWFVDDSFGWGFASSPAIWKGRVILQCDVKGGAFAAAFALEDGEELWRVKRDELPSWGSPAIYEGPEGPEVVMNATNAICSYDPTSGEELWRIEGNSKITIATPVIGDGLIIATGGYQTPAPIYAVRAGARGDLTPPIGASSTEALAWSTQRGGTGSCMPLLYEGLLYVLHGSGVMTCYVAETGEQMYKERVAGVSTAHTAAPVAADGFLYITGEAGDVYVVRAGREFELVAVNHVGGSTLATPAISNGIFLVRKLDELVALSHR